MKVIISGGGTGGHIFPAIAIADELKNRGFEILFVGAHGRMEMEKVPAAGYTIEGLPVKGIERRLTLSNLKVPFMTVSALYKANRIISRFRPDVAVGVGGYASGPLLFMAALRNIPALIQEQNSFPGLTNRILSRVVKKICVAYDGMEKFFPSRKIVLTGNPVRKELVRPEMTRSEAMRFWELDPSRPTLLVLGGSLGARTINRCITGNIEKLLSDDIQVVWQTGKNYFDGMNRNFDLYRDHPNAKNFRISAFITRMDCAYAAADIVLARAGAISVSELCITGKAAILVPSPNVAEDHQTRNARFLSDRNAAILLNDSEAEMKFYSEFQALLSDRQRQKKLSENILRFARPLATTHITDAITELTKVETTIKSQI